MSAVNEKLKYYRKLKKISYSKLSDLTGIPKATLQRYETGTTKKIPLDALTTIEEALKIIPGTLMGWIDNENNRDNNLTALPQSNIYLRPIFDSVAAGFGAIAQDTIIGYMPTYISCSSEKEQYIWVNVKGDSMSPLIDDGSKILIKKQSSIDSGRIAVVLIDDEEAVVKKVVYDDDWIELQSINPYYPPRRFTGAETHKLKILGLVKEVSKTL